MDRIENKSALVHVMALRQTGAKPFLEPLLTYFLNLYGATRPHRVKISCMAYLQVCVDGSASILLSWHMINNSVQVKYAWVYLDSVRITETYRHLSCWAGIVF